MIKRQSKISGNISLFSNSSIFWSFNSAHDRISNLYGDVCVKLHESWNIYFLTFE